MNRISNDLIEIIDSGMDYVNPKAKVVIVGITPGESQMKVSRSGKSAKEIKRENAFAGIMRINLVKMLDAIGVNKLLKIKTCDTLWSTDFDKVQMTSLLRNATYYKGTMFKGTPSILKTSKLMDELMSGFVKHDCCKCTDAILYVALGKTVKEVLEWLKQNKGLHAQIVTIPHASGFNGGRIAVFLKRRPPKDANTSEMRAAEMRRVATKTMSKLLTS